MRDLRTLAQAWFGKEERLVWLHANHLGAIEAATDEEGKAIWRADYQPFGQVQIVKANASSFDFDLRLPGQYEDRESGLYYNGHRYYDPAQGRYLTPDPLGMPDGPNPYAYVRGNPLRSVDPLGLILFAFDGTGNSNPAPAGDTISNVSKFLQAYDQDANGPAFYITGIGTTNKDMPYKGDIKDGDGFDQRLLLGFKFLNDFIDKDAGTDTINIDVVGFSRGAAEARVWINQLVGKMSSDGLYTSAMGKSRCLNLRFEGLWDAVPHLGLFNGNEAKYDFSIPSQVKYAVQALALNEYRGEPVDFDVRSLWDSPQSSNTANRIEKGFIGAHSDIGGSYGTGDLSDIALMWMINQAKSQKIVMNETVIKDNGWNVISDPVLHDSSSNLLYGAPDGGPSASSIDRQIIYGNGTKMKQRERLRQAR